MATKKNDPMPTRKNEPMATKRMEPMATKKAEPITAKKPAVTPPNDKSTKRNKSTEAPLMVSAPQRPSFHEIAKRAYSLWERRGYAHGHDVEDWLTAETELMHRKVFPG